MVIDDVAEFLEKTRWTIDWPSKRKKVDYRLTHQHIYIYIYIYIYRLFEATKTASTRTLLKHDLPFPGFPSPTVSRNGPNTVSESTVSNTELSELCGPHPVPGRELTEFLSAYYLCAKANSPSFSQNSPSLPPNSVSPLFRNSTLEAVFRHFPSFAMGP